jgi:hypothetical protein
MQVTISCAFENSAWPFTLISEHSQLSMPECRITVECINAQHPLNMTSVSKLRQISVIKLLPAAQLQSAPLGIT